jgi:hypothetical protein
MAAWFVVFSPHRFCSFISQFLVSPWRLAALIIDPQPSKSILFGEVPTVIKRAGNLEGLVMSAGIRDRWWDGLEIFGDPLLDGRF